MLRRTILGSITLLLMTLGLAAPIAADSVAVTIGVGDTVADISGLTSPGAFVTIKDSGAVVGTTVADSSGNFFKELIAQDGGIHDLTIFSRSTANNISDATTLSVSYTEHFATNISVFLAPTLLLSPSTPTTTSPIVMHGETFSGGIIQVYVDQRQPLQTTADNDGNWSLTLTPSNLGSGTHSIVAVGLDGLGRQSTPTTARYVTIPSSVPMSTPSRFSLSQLFRRPLSSTAAPIVTVPPIAPTPGDFTVHLTNPKPYQTVSNRVTISINVIDGSAPYDYVVQWGDNATGEGISDISPITLSHTYATAGTFHGSIRITDALGKVVTRSFDVHIRDVVHGVGRTWSPLGTLLGIAAAAIVLGFGIRRWLLLRRK